MRWCDDRMADLRVDKVVQLGLALRVVAGDAHDVTVILGDEVGILAGESRPHPLGVIDILAKHDGLGEAVAAEFEELRHFFRHEGGAFFENQLTIKVLLIVDAIGDDGPVLVGLLCGGAPAGEILVEMDAHDFVRCEKSILDALLERVGVDRIAEVGDVGNLLGLLGRRSETEMRG